MTLTARMGTYRSPGCHSWSLWRFCRAAKIDLTIPVAQWTWDLPVNTIVINEWWLLSFFTINDESLTATTRSVRTALGKLIWTSPLSLSVELFMRLVRQVPWDYISDIPWHPQIGKCDSEWLHDYINYKVLWRAYSVVHTLNLRHVSISVHLQLICSYK